MLFFDKTYSALIVFETHSLFLEKKRKFFEKPANN